MSLTTITVIIAIAVIGLVAYSTLIVANKQSQIALRVRDENRFIRAPRYPYTAASRFAFETGEELIEEGEIKVTED